MDGAPLRLDHHFADDAAILERAQHRRRAERAWMLATLPSLEQLSDRCDIRFFAETGGHIRPCSRPG
jgi:hypothetical protein